MTFGSLFAGIGGLDLGLERAGMTCKWQVENDEYATKVLEKHWPSVRRWGDVRTFPPAGEWGVDLIAGGFPCQGVSASNYRGKGLQDERSGLWFEFARVLRQLRPRYALVENVPAITFRGLTRVLGDLAEIGFDAEWQTVRASDVGAPHERSRLFIVAYPAGERCEADAIFSGCPFEEPGEESEARVRHWPGRIESSCTLPNRIRWVPDSGVCRVANGNPGVLDRYRVIGNAVVPQVAQWIGERIMEADRGDHKRKSEGARV